MDSFIIPAQNGPVTPQVLAARQRMAQAMMQQGMSDAPTTALGALARAVQGGIGGWAMNKANEGYQSGIDTYRQRLANALNTGSPNDMAAAVSDPFGDPSVAMNLPNVAHAQAQWQAQDKFAHGDQSAFTTAFPQQAGELAAKQMMMGAMGDMFDRANGRGGAGQPAPGGAMPSQGMPQQPQMQPPAFAPLPGAPGAGQMPMPQDGGGMPPQAPQMAPQGQPKAPQQAPVQNPAQPASGLQFDANGIPNQPITDSSKIPVPDEIYAQAKMAATNPSGNGLKDGTDYIRNWQEKTAAALNDAYYKGSGYLTQKGNVDAGNNANNKFEESKGAAAAEVINNKPAAIKRMQVLNTLSDLWQKAGGNITTGPYAQAILGLKQALVGAGFDVQDATSPTELVNKLGMQLSAEDTKSFTSRPSQMELNMFLKANPGMTMTPQGNMRVINFKKAMAQRDIDLADSLMQQGVKYTDLPTIMDAYDKAHPLKSIIDGSPIGGGPQVGAVEDGYQYIGGDPSNQNSWKKVQ